MAQVRSPEPVPGTLATVCPVLLVAAFSSLSAWVRAVDSDGYTPRVFMHQRGRSAGTWLASGSACSDLVARLLRERDATTDMAPHVTQTRARAGARERPSA
jgi:hypothetical protein